MSFHELREALVCAFSDGLISEEEFLILYEECESTNLNFPHWEYKPFSIDNFDSSEVRARFRVDKEDIPYWLTLYRSQNIFDALKEQVKLSAAAEVVTLSIFNNTQINN